MGFLPHCHLSPLVCNNLHILVDTFNSSSFPIQIQEHLIFPCLFSSVYSSSHDFPWPSHNIHFLIVYHLWFIFSLLQVKLTWWRGCITSLELHAGLANICGVPRGAWNCGQWQGTDYKLKSVPIPGGLTECARQSHRYIISAPCG